jgi:hypothetical protein
MTPDDATILRLLAEALRSRVMTDKQMDLFAAACDRIAGVETAQMGATTIHDVDHGYDRLDGYRMDCLVWGDDEEAGP